MPDITCTLLSGLINYLFKFSKQLRLAKMTIHVLFTYVYLAVLATLCVANY